MVALGITKAMVGLSNVENTADLAKPISTATQAALDLKTSNTTLALKENIANKSSATDLGGINPSDILFPTQKAVKTYVDQQLTVFDATSIVKGKIKLAGDLGGTADLPTVPGLSSKEDTSNKSTTTTLGTSNQLFPTQNAVKTYVDAQVATATIADADAVTKGKIKLDGNEINSNNNSWRTLVGYVPQNIFLADGRSTGMSSPKKRLSTLITFPSTTA